MRDQQERLIEPLSEKEREGRERGKTTILVILGAILGRLRIYTLYLLAVSSLCPTRYSIADPQEYIK